jgi:hypothetical protein
MRAATVMFSTAHFVVEAHLFSERHQGLAKCRLCQFASDEQIAGHRTVDCVARLFTMV